MDKRRFANEKRKPDSKEMQRSNSVVNNTGGACDEVTLENQG